MNKLYGRFRVSDEGYETKEDWYRGINKGIYELKDLFPDAEIQVFIGTDSNKNNPCLVYSTVVAIHAIGSGGRVYYMNSIEAHGETRKKKFKNKKAYMKYRLWTEQVKSIQVAHDLEDIFVEHVIEWGTNPKTAMVEVHADVNRKAQYLSHEVVNDICGYIFANGFMPNPKPDSFAATNIADDITRKFNWQKYMKKINGEWVILT